MPPTLTIRPSDLCAATPATRPSRCALVRRLCIAAVAAAATAAHPGAVAAQSLEPTALVDQRGGATLAVDAADDLVVAGLGPRVVVYSRTEEGFTPIGRSPVLPAVVEEIALGTHAALVGVRGGDVHVVDLREPARPRLGALVANGADRRHVDPASGSASEPVQPSLAWSAEGVAVVTEGSRLRLTDLRDPLAAGSSATLELEGTAVGVVRDAVGVIVGTADGTLRRLVAEPAAPAQSRLEALPAPMPADMERLADASGVRLLSVHAPNPEMISVVDLASNENDRMRMGLFSRPQRSAIADGRAWMASPGGTGIVSTALPKSPLRLDYRTTDTLPLPEGAMTYDLAATETHLFVAAGASGLLVYRLDGSSRPPLVTASRDAVNIVFDVAVTSGHAVVATRWGWCTLALGEALRLQECVDTPTAPLTVAASGGWAVVGAHRVIDPPPPDPNRRDVTEIHVLGPHPETGVGLHPIRVIERWGDGQPVAAAIEGRFAYVATLHDRLLVVDLLAQPWPAVVHKLELGVDVTDLAVRAGRAIVAHRRGLVSGILDFDPNAALSPSPARSLEFVPNSFLIPPAAAMTTKHWLVANGQAVYVVSPDEEAVGTVVGQIDLPEFAPPVMAQQLPPIMPGTQGHGRDVVGIDVDPVSGAAWVSHGVSGLFEVNLTLPGFPEVRTHHDTPGSARAIAASGSTLYVADGDGGLAVVHRRDWTAPGRVFLPWARR